MKLISAPGSCQSLVLCHFAQLLQKCHRIFLGPSDNGRQSLDVNATESFAMPSHRLNKCLRSMDISARKDRAYSQVVRFFFRAIYYPNFALSPVALQATSTLVLIIHPARRLSIIGHYRIIEIDLAKCLVISSL